MKQLKQIALAVLCLVISFKSKSQINVHSEDLKRFYMAFDSVLTTTDTLKQEAYIQKLYTDKASAGLRKFMDLRGGNTRAWRIMINERKAELIEKRPWILSVLKQEKTINKYIKRFKKVYPDFRSGDIYFCVGIQNSGGTIYDNTVYIGAEIAASEKDDWAVALVLHEFGHTQQWTQRNILQLVADTAFANTYLKTHKQLLGKCIEEGMCDFISELCLGKPLSEIHPQGHTAFGLQHEASIWQQFKKDMLENMDDEKGWLYKSKIIDGQKMTDIGYFVGHQICKSYYNRAKNKKAAIKYMFNLNLTDENCKKFLEESGYGK